MFSNRQLSCLHCIQSYTVIKQMAIIGHDKLCRINDQHRLLWRITGLHISACEISFRTLWKKNGIPSLFVSHFNINILQHDLLYSAIFRWNDADETSFSSTSCVISWHHSRCQSGFRKKAVKPGVPKSWARAKSATDLENLQIGFLKIIIALEIYRLAY